MLCLGLEISGQGVALCKAAKESVVNRRSRASLVWERECCGPLAYWHCSAVSFPRGHVEILAETVHTPLMNGFGCHPTTNCNIYMHRLPSKTQRKCLAAMLAFWKRKECLTSQTVPRSRIMCQKMHNGEMENCIFHNVIVHMLHQVTLAL